MSHRTDAQAGIDAQKAKQGTQDSISPTSQADETFQPILDGARMLDEASHTAMYQRGYAAGVVDFNDPVLEIANTQIYNDSSDISKVSDKKIRLEAGNKYKIEAMVNCVGTPVNYYADFQLFDASNNTFIGVVGTIVLSNNGANSGSQIPCIAYISQPMAVEFELHFNGGDEITNYNAVITIEKL